MIPDEFGSVCEERVVPQPFKPCLCMPTHFFELVYLQRPQLVFIADQSDIMQGRGVEQVKQLFVLKVHMMGHVGRDIHLLPPLSSCRRP